MRYMVTSKWSTDAKIRYINIYNLETAQTLKRKLEEMGHRNVRIKEQVQ